MMPIPSVQLTNCVLSLEVQDDARLMRDETRHCEMMQDGVAELLSFLLPSFVKLAHARFHIVLHSVFK